MLHQNRIIFQAISVQNVLAGEKARFDQNHKFQNYTFNKGPLQTHSYIYFSAHLWEHCLNPVAMKLPSFHLYHGWCCGHNPKWIKMLLSKLEGSPLFQ